MINHPFVVYLAAYREMRQLLLKENLNKATHFELARQYALKIMRGYRD